jgi:hypothetical protein
MEYGLGEQIARGVVERMELLPDYVRGRIS